jgi:hypothetical protein
MSSEVGGGEGGSRRVSFGAGGVVSDDAQMQGLMLRADAATARLSLEPQPPNTGRVSAAGLSKTPIHPAVGSSVGMNSSMTPAAVVTATPTSNGPIISPAVTAAILAGVAPAAERDAQMKVLLLQNMIQQWSFLLARQVSSAGC